MVAPTFKKASDATAGGSTKHGAQDINYGWNVLDGTHSTDRVQVENIERVTNPWNYYIYKSGSNYIARRGDTGRAEFTNTNASALIASAITQSQTDYSMSVLMFAPQTFDLNAVDISIAQKSNVTFAGAGIDKTILQNGGIIKNHTTTTNNIVIKDMTIDKNAVTTSSSRSAIHLGTNTVDARLLNVKAMNSYGTVAGGASSFILSWGGVDRLIAENCIFYNNTATEWDNCAGSQLTTTNGRTIFSHCYFERTGNCVNTGGMLTCGNTGNLLVDGCLMHNSSSSETAGSYAAVSIENNSGNPPVTAGAPLSKSITISNCMGIGHHMRFQIGNSNDDLFDKAIISNTIAEEGIMIRGARTAIMSNCTIHNSDSYGIWMIGNYPVSTGVPYQLTYAAINNCTVINTNMTSGSTSDKGGLWSQDVAFLNVNNLTVVDNQTTGTTPHGIRITQTAVPSNEVRLTDCKLIGPFTSNALRIDNTAKVVIRGGKIVGTTSFSGNTDTAFKISEVDGYNPLGLATVTLASGATYTNNDRVVETIYMTGGTITAMTKNGTSIGTPGAVRLEPGDTFVPTYTGSPTIVKDRQ